MKRAVGLAEHLLHDYHKDLPGGVTLIPSSGGVFEVSFGDQLIFSKKAVGRFPDDGEIGARLTQAVG